MIDIRRITNTAQAIVDNEALGREHYDEIALNKQVMVYAPDVSKYAQLEEVGALLTLGAYDKDNLVGYSVNILTPHLHYQNLLCCHNDMLYLHPDYRQGLLGVRLIKTTRAAARALGVQFMLWHAKPGTNLDKLLRRLGCAVQDVLYSEVL